MFWRLMRNQRAEWVFFAVLAILLVLQAAGW